jgi:6-phosphogluconolactonase
MRRSFGTREDLALALAGTVIARLGDGIAARGEASLAVSGGTTPARLFGVLSHRADLDWSKVHVTLVDERWVPAESDRSNAGLVQRTLLQHAAAPARFVPLYSGGGEPDDAAIARTNARLLGVPRPFDAIILGMGNDGHTASFFPGGDTLETALTGEGPAIAIRAPGAGESRVTLTLPCLLDSAALYLHIEGEEKAGTLARAEQAGPIAAMPVRAILRQSRTPLTIFWSP